MAGRGKDSPRKGQPAYADALTSGRGWSVSLPRKMLTFPLVCTVRKQCIVLNTRVAVAFFAGQTKTVNCALACCEVFVPNYVHYYDVIIIGHKHCSSRFTGMLLLPMSV